MNETFKSFILRQTDAECIKIQEQIQELWSGYGTILRVALKNASVPTVVIKHIRTTKHNHHPRGWNTDIGHERKLKSYQVEANWYKNYSQSCTARLPHCFGIERCGDEVMIILEDLDEAGYALRKKSVEWEDIAGCLQWLAQFHASYLGKIPDGLWQNGTYWHLDTRPDELVSLKDVKLKEAAPLIDYKLNNCRYKSLVHGDAKLANFCFSPIGQVAGVDFQYVGGGCGMKDVAYFIGSCLDEQECEKLESKILDTYFYFLQGALPNRNETLEKEWRSMYRLAWADFHRFLKGWNPGHWKINSYSERVTDSVIKSL
ncbi:MAG TPA: hypothetical protein VJ917_12295 [Saprospiraceae bacterium]|nr:hypothetical protein [Saprospiraceae bacterium]